MPENRYVAKTRASPILFNKGSRETEIRAMKPLKHLHTPNSIHSVLESLFLGQTSWCVSDPRQRLDPIFRLPENPA
jgi:hypothetical protein